MISYGEIIIEGLAEVIWGPFVVMLGLSWNHVGHFGSPKILL